uniref:ATP synthase complex subunit 8 n=1 Tax=Allonychiurus kimi TaxID=2779777 RepID=A0A7M3UYT8_9HEXA|nr:ATP synthase F0 subunit 8 [Allonychiurus kimi]QOL12115.1 ATP synthase F0 subunit 8 [Allonychiurus kimi]
MPQMAPMNWIFLYLMFFLIMILSFYKIFYMFVNNNETDHVNTANSYNTLPWKW